jgi:hypothetical protein
MTFKRYPPFRYYVDATRDPTWAEIITKKLGENVVNEYKYTQDSKLRLKTTTRQYLMNGYTFPDADLLQSQGKISMEKAEWIREIKDESLREQMKPTVGDKISFDHGGKHNDLNAAFEMSMQAVYDYQKNNFGNHGNDIVYGGSDDGMDGLSDSDVMINNMKNRFSKYSEDINISISYD